ncbi:MAG TPA: hypothetical protein VHA15_13345 [Burkholderiales bacterium]|jgi:hypothetical protein|nr:hypothetical protein [Burkholderiales bacterium]
MDKWLAESADTSVIDDVTGAYLVDDGRALRLCVMGEVYDPDAALPRGIRREVDADRDARSFVCNRMARKFGQDRRCWPLTARYFVLA